MNPKEKNIDYHVLIAKVLSNEATDEEINMVEHWISASEENRKLFDEYKKVLSAIDLEKQVEKIDLDKEWAIMKSNIDSAEATKISYSTKSRYLLNSLRVNYAAAAAVVFLVVFFGLKLIRSLNSIEFTTGVLAEQIFLPDSSKVNLNAYSSIVYPRNFSKNKREISFRGEAYFEVVSDPEKPFSINTNEVLIEVLGTSFNLNAYKHLESIEVVVNTGKVALMSLQEENERVILEAGNKGVYSKKDGKVSGSLNTDINFLSWKTRKLVFINEEFGNIINTLGNVYYKEIVILNENLIPCRVTSTFDQLPFDAVLRILEATLGLEVEEKESVIYIDGPGC
ncbi:MAG: FecR domain-containing protein [Bacteroidota bacterium]|nr:FecR domain-containing protein [Bacteroidota bacterium]